MSSRKFTAGPRPDGAALRMEIARIRSLKIDDLRGLWRATFKKDVPKALTKDLVSRMLIWRLQEQAFGGFDRATLKILGSYAKGQPMEAKRLRRLKPGTELVREYQGERHTVIVMTEGFAWRGVTYKSLTTIAKEITGTNWNGPRFFGLRVAEIVSAAAVTSPSPRARQRAVGQGAQPS